MKPEHKKLSNTSWSCTLATRAKIKHNQRTIRCSGWMCPSKVFYVVLEITIWMTPKGQHVVLVTILLVMYLKTVTVFCNDNLRDITRVLCCVLNASFLYGRSKGGSCPLIGPPILERCVRMCVRVHILRIVWSMCPCTHMPACVSAGSAGGGQTNVSMCGLIKRPNVNIQQHLVSCSSTLPAFTSCNTWARSLTAGLPLELSYTAPV